MRANNRFIPYLSLHEYEALLFSDPDALAQALNQPPLSEHFGAIRRSFPSPEDISDGSETAPSKRISALVPYKKVIDGTLAAQSVGVARMRLECPHFSAWLDQFANLAPL